MWRLKKRIIKKSGDKPTAKKDELGNLITSHNGLLKLYQETYIERLKHREMSPELQDLKVRKEALFDMRLKMAAEKPSEPFTEEMLMKVLKSLKNNKARDPYGIIYELFKPNLAGKDLIESLLLLFNAMKSNLHIPEYMLTANITYSGR